MKTLGPLLFAFTLLACQNFPRDPELTLKQVQNQTLRAGITHNPPFTIVHDTDSLGGTEVALVQNLARELNARIEWSVSSEEELFGRLEKFELDLVIGGITAKSPWKKHAGFTRPYLTVHTQTKKKRQYVFAVPPGENAFLMRVEEFLHKQKTLNPQ